MHLLWMSHRREREAVAAHMARRRRSSSWLSCCRGRMRGRQSCVAGSRDCGLKDWLDDDGAALFYVLRMFSIATPFKQATERNNSFFVAK